VGTGITVSADGTRTATTTGCSGTNVFTDTIPTVVVRRARTTRTTSTTKAATTAATGPTCSTSRLGTFPLTAAVGSQRIENAVSTIRPTIRSPSVGLGTLTAVTDNNRIVGGVVKFCLPGPDLTGTAACASAGIFSGTTTATCDNQIINLAADNNLKIAVTAKRMTPIGSSRIGVLGDYPTVCLLQIGNGSTRRGNRPKEGL
jgi:hypothetical protein